jgi:hypothetical protein
MTVRTCATCKHASAISVRDWPTSTSFMGLPTGSGPVSRQDFRCQSCGARFTLRGAAMVRAVLGPMVFLPFVPIGALVGLGGLTQLSNEPAYGIGLASFGGVLAGLAGLATAHFIGPLYQQLRNPVAPDAPMPVLRFNDVPPMRRCSCGRAAPVTRIVAETTNHIPTGTDSTHTCGCGKQFVVSDLWGLVFMLMAMAVVTFLALFCVDAALEDDASWGTIAFAAFLVLVSVGGTAAWVHGVAKRYWLHPLVPSTAPAAS